ncbi:MutS family DNA mismatch repair protein [Clostridium oryzae]|uniref:DNA mismatch repair protein MutS n=1 Tax=Clostridium oryzae TaxID=1450648 RepID=A0A1V4I989_9CLOT|nr:MutS family DNA mismatch repair protein [Clostridium oryzae]OPJ56562.1 DNA mismatch repair protein MutS [Clostridium oryzae]
MVNIYNEYLNKLNTYEYLIKKQNNSINIIKYFRFFTFMIGLSVTVYTFIIKSYIVSMTVFIISLAISVYLIIESNKEINKRNYSIALKEINLESLKRLNEKWKNFEDDGSEFKNIQHSYSDDLDIFGKGSLFQWINTTKTFMGREILKNRSTNPLSTSADIQNTQQSLHELAINLEWRQKFEAEGMLIINQCIDPKELYKWGRERNELYTKSWFILLVRLLPCLTLALIISAYFTSLINFTLPCFMVCVQLIMLFIGGKKRSITFNSIYKYKDNINVYFRLLSSITYKDFKSDYLKQLKDNLVTYEGESAVNAIKRLTNIYGRISERQNVFFIIFNILLLWDYQCMIEFEKWRNNSGKNLEKWFDVIGQFEALNSISNIIYNNPQWVVPLITDGDYIVKSNGLGHPLLSDKRVCNDITINTDKNILLITGSNMSGKSTFLRTIGINLVLSYIGATVCADKFECSLMKIFTCMRTNDNLENNISSFYAEILRIKMIVEETKKNKKIFFLLDELFKGTNSIDRHDGAKALIRQLGEQGASGLISTHDLELCCLEHEYSKVINYHFQEYYLNSKLKFNYKLLEGISTTRNAMYLINLAGIDIK